MANIHGVGDLENQGNANYGEYSALRGNQRGAFGGFPNMGRDPYAEYPRGHTPMAIQKRFPDICEIFAPWFHTRSVTFFLTMLEVTVYLVTMWVGHSFFDGAFVKGNESAGPSSKTLIFMGARSTPLIRENFEYWRLVTPILLHEGVKHLVFNLLFFSYIGYTLELRWGRLNSLLVFVISGITGNMLSTLGRPESISVGASGSLCGMLGANLVYLFLNWSLIPEWEETFEVCSIVLVLLLTFTLGDGTNDNFAHVGGFLGGIICGFSLVKLLRPEQERNKDLYRKGGMIGILIVWSVFFLMLYVVPLGP
eukprot:CAMPEP_0167753758 /NCGR_PEP_ID=MMETSP0110_2-20121227/7892_1 /TAXON_ID=629695 /ORGANISM="Gymnochlora sp., Strain CCMP2014" /LENGTH=308 /DNA_ID=CAMNT_0007639561 /DNA_START=929 /DNA_END=1855 /DNA_ORIENTATION=-